MSRRGSALWAMAALIGMATTAQANLITRDVVVWYGDPVGAGTSEVYVFCLSPRNPDCGQLGNQFPPDLGSSDNRFHPLAAPPAIDSNGHLIVVEENTSGIPGTEDAAVVRRIETDIPFFPSGRIANVALIGGFSMQPGPFKPTDTVLVHNRVLMIADAGPSSATFPATVDDGQILRVDTASGASSVVTTGLVNPSAIAADATGQLWVADDLAGFSPARSQLLRVDPVSGSQTLIANEGTGFDPYGPAIDIALLPGGDVLWLSRGLFTPYQIMRIDASTGDGTVVAEFFPALATPTGLSAGRYLDTQPEPDVLRDLVLLSVRPNAAAIDPETGMPFGNTGAFFEVDVTTPFVAGSPTANLSTFFTTGFLGTLVPQGLAIAPFTECNDGIDNGFPVGADFGGDPGCSGRFDVSEAFDCVDGLDNDLDGTADSTAAFGLEDGCEPTQDPFTADASEEPDCADRIDNDGDGFVDYDGGVLVRTCDDDLDCFANQRCRNDFCSPGLPAAADSGCPDTAGAREDPECSDGVDNDLDGRTDWPADGTCAGPSEDSEAMAACNDGFDNDGDGLIDTDGGLLRIACAAATDCPAFETCEAGICSNPVFVGRDPQCLRASHSEAAGDCADGLDNDGDGGVDEGGGLVFAPCVVDADCQSADICPGGGCACTDSVCFPGTPAAADPQCLGLPGDVEETTECNDGVDNDGDGLVDWEGSAGPEVCTTDADCLERVTCSTASATAGKPVGCHCLGGICSAGDPGCGSRGWFSESPACDDGIENEDGPEQDNRVDFHGVGFYNFDTDSDTDHFTFDLGFRLPDPGCRAAFSDDEAPACNDGIDNDEDFDFDDGDTYFDYREFVDCQGGARAAPLHCGADGGLCFEEDNGLGLCIEALLDSSADPDCKSASQDSEGPRLQSLCGLGWELALVLPLLQALRFALRRRRRAPGTQPG